MGLSFAWLGVRFDARDPGLPALGLTEKRGLAEANPGTRVRNSPRAFVNEWHEKEMRPEMALADPDWLRTNHSVPNWTRRELHSRTRLQGSLLTSEQRSQPGAPGHETQRRTARAELHGSGERADQPIRASSSSAA